MDAKFLELMGNYLLNLSQMSKFQEEAFKFWSGLMGSPKEAGPPVDPSGIFEQQWDLFRKLYGLEKKPPAPDFAETWRKSSEEFQRSIREFMAGCDYVPSNEYEQLKKEHEELKKKFEDQNETIRQLQTKKIIQAGEEMGFASGIQDLVKTQTEQFTTLMESLSGVYGQDAAAGPKASKSKKGKAGGEK